jgi:hypothetical protein
LIDSSIYQYTEPSTEEKVKDLIEKGQFQVALSIAKAQGLSADAIAAIHRQQGDVFYKDRKYGDAIQEYKLAIGAVEAAYVIQRYLAPQHAKYLIDFLEALQNCSAEVATLEIQTNLLFNCYVRLDQKDEIHSRIDLACELEERGLEPPFDVDQAIEALTRGKLFEESRKLAVAFKRNRTYARLQADDGHWRDVAAFIPPLPFEDVEVLIRQYGLQLFEILEDKDCEKLIAELAALVMTGRRATGEVVPQRMDPEIFRSVLAVHPTYYYQFLRRIADFDPSRLSTSLWDDYIMTTIDVNPNELADVLDNPSAGYSPEQALIAVYDARQRYANDADRSAAVSAGLKVLYQRRGCSLDIIPLVEPEDLPETCKELSAQNPVAWEAGLRAAVSSKNASAIQNLVDRAFKTGALSIFEVLPALLKHSASTYGIVKEEALRFAAELSKSEADKSATLAALDAKLAKIQAENDRLEKEVVPVRLGQCGVCNQQADRPARFFACGHAFHLRCLGVADQACPSCHKEQFAAVSAKKRAFEKAKKHTNIVAELEDADDPIAAFSTLITATIFNDDIAHGGEEEADRFLERLEAV